MDPIQIPDKTYFKIGEVAKLLDLQPYVLRYWETEFDALRPEKTKTGQRAYRRDDIELLLLVKVLLYDEMYTIAGARRQIKLRKKGAIEPLGPEAQQRLVTDHQALVAEKALWADERRRLADAADKHREEASRLRVHNETLEDENAQLAAAQLEYESSIGRLREDVASRRNAVRQLEDSNLSLEQKVEELEEDSSSRSDQAELQVRNSENVERIAALQSERDEALNRVELVSSDLAEELARVHELEKALEAANQAVEQGKHEQQRLAEEVESLEADLASAETELERLEGEKAALAAQSVDTSELDALEAQLLEALGQIEALQSERDGARHRQELQKEQQRARFVLLRTELETLSAIVN